MTMAYARMTWCAALCAAVCLCATGFAEDSGPVAELMSRPGLSGGWVRDGQFDCYTPDNVFELIDGEAELYFPYGLKRVLAGKYAQAGGATPVSVELYELGSPLDAFGAYSNFRDKDSALIRVGGEGFAGSTQVMFYQDRWFVKARVNRPEDKDALLAFVRALADALPPQPAPPAALTLLAIDGAVPGTLQYVGRDLLGYAFLPRGLMAEVDVDGKPVRVFVVMAGTAKEAGKVLADYAAYLEKEGAPRRWVDTAQGQALAAQDPLHKGVLIQHTGNWVAGVAKLAAPDDGLPLLERLAAHVAGHAAAGAEADDGQP